ncbi:MAG: rhomboid family intramembrane serine protease [Gemmatimonadota bacterium]|nr:MAG: rhomboid family intramembrane serine protease [Gemmatimonadota bacterium]
MVNAVIYLLMLTVFTGNWVYEVGAFNPASVMSRLWTFVTYMFLHGSFMHLLMNLLLLFIFGPAVEMRMGGPTFAAYYFTCGLGGAITHLVISGLTSPYPMIGASAAVLGVALAFAIYWPNEPIHVFPLPMPIKVKWLVAFLVVLDLVAARSGAQDGVAHFAHLGGFLFGYIFLRSRENLARGSQAIVSRTRKPMTANRPRPKEAVGAVRPETDKAEPKKSADYDEIDRVLDKISEKGLDSLTPEERGLLDEASRNLRKH